MDKNYLVVRNNVRGIRLAKGLSQEDLAKMCSSSVCTINAIESDLFVCSVFLALCLSTALDVPLDDLFFLDIKEVNH